jgi:hypothetical protein
LQLSILSADTFEELVILANNNFPGIVGEVWEPYPLQRLNSMPCYLLEIQITLPHGHTALISAYESIFVVTMPVVAEMFITVFDKMTHGVDFKLVNLLDPKNRNLIHKDLNTSIAEPDICWNIHLVSYDTLTSSAKPSSTGRLSQYSWCFESSEVSYQYKGKNSVG